MMKKVCVVTGTRAEYGLLKPVILRIIEDESLELMLYVTGAHLSPEFGLTYQEIEADNILINRKIEMLLSSDTKTSVVKSMGVELISLADVIGMDKPDIIVLLGDRYEIMVVAIAAMVLGIPIAHIHGGEATEGLIDESIRHSITKMSHLHFAAAEEYKKRIIQLGEQPENVYNVGALGVENIKTMSLLNQKELEEDLHISFQQKIAMVTYHPVTLENDTAKVQFENLLRALDECANLFVIFTHANSDADGRVINELIEAYVKERTHRCVVFSSLGQKRYLSILKYCSIVIGNSSSGLIEVPSFHIPTVNIGDRQRGRLCASSVINTECEQKKIVEAIHLGMSVEFQGRISDSYNPYAKENTSSNIVQGIKTYLHKNVDLKKVFYDL